MSSREMNHREMDAVTRKQLRQQLRKQAKLILREAREKLRRLAKEGASKEKLDFEAQGAKLEARNLLLRVEQLRKEVGS